MIVREFSVNIMGGLMDYLDTLGEKYKVLKLEPEDTIVEFDFEEQEGLNKALIFEAADYVSSFTNHKEKRESFIKCCEQLRLIEKDEIEQFANLSGYFTLVRA